MKNLYILFALLITTQLFSNELAWVDEQIEAIKPARVGVSSNEISKLKDPFIFLHKKEEKETSKGKDKLSNSYSKYKKIAKRKRVYFRLDAILNTSAMINGKWYKQGSYIYGYKVAQVNRKTVLLTSKNKSLLLSTEKRSKKIKINNK